MSRWTENQQKAIRKRNCDLLVAAAAGSGKTAVLVERILTLVLEDGIDIDKLLVVTFTNAAAMEMRQRISEAIRNKLTLEPENEQLRKQSVLLNKADIITIHSFCLKVMRENFSLLDLDPAFRIGDETESKLLCLEVIEAVFEEFYEGHQEFPALVESFGNQTKDDQLVELVLKIYEYIQANPFPLDWLSEQVEKFHCEDIDHSPWAVFLTGVVRQELAYAHRLVQEALVCTGLPGGPMGYRETLLLDEKNLKQALSVNSFSAQYTTLAKIQFKTIGRCTKETDPRLKEKAKAARDEAKSIVQNIQEKIFFKSPGQLLSDIHLLYPAMKTLLDVTQAFSIRYQEAKREKNIVDFNDLEHFCLEALISQDEEGQYYPSKIADFFMDKYEEILIDEYQDSNLVQEMILESISKKRLGTPNRFMVGDVKQSIYRFRLARPELFLDKYNRYQDTGLYQKVTLDKNFRSRKEILDAVNFIFMQIMSDEVGEMAYGDQEALYAGMEFPECPHKTGGPVEVLLLDRGAAPQEDGILLDMTAAEWEGALIGKKINQLMAENYHVWDHGQYRKLEYKDIAILLRTQFIWAEAIKDTLLSMNIPAVTDQNGGYYEAVEVQTALSFLKIIDNSLQDIPLLACLRSDVFAFTSNDFAAIRSQFPDTALFFALDQYALAGEDRKLARKTGLFLQKLADWKRHSTFLPLDDFILYLYDDTGLFDIAGVMKGGEVRQANLRMLYERAVEFGQSSLRGLFHFILYIEKLQERNQDMGGAIVSLEENVVNITSIHKSKGLEYPVVFIGEMGKRLNFRDTQQKVLLHQDYGLGPQYLDLESRVSSPSIAKTAIARKIMNESLSEEMRILYVAMTRAKEKLFLVGSGKNILTQCEKAWAVAHSADEKLPFYPMGKATHYFQWVLPAICRHRDGGKFMKKMFALDEITMPEHLWRHASFFLVDYFTLSDIELEKVSANSITPQKETFASQWDEKDLQQLQDALSWQYPYEQTTKIPASISISEIKRRYHLEQQEYSAPMKTLEEKNLPVPAFMQDTLQAGAMKGVVIHTIMEKMDFSRLYTKADLDTLIESLLAQGIFTKEDISGVHTEWMVRFSSSPLGERLRKSSEIIKEKMFTLPIQPKTAYFETPGNDGTILVHGVIDCFFKEEDGYVLVDYKSDFIAEDGLEDFKKKYKVQLDLYQMAIENIMGIQVKEKIIYSFQKGIISMD